MLRAGILLRRLLGDPSLSGTTHVVLDEVGPWSMPCLPAWPWPLPPACPSCAAPGRAALRPPPKHILPPLVAVCSLLHASSFPTGSSPGCCVNAWPPCSPSTCSLAHPQHACRCTSAQSSLTCSCCCCEACLSRVRSGLPGRAAAVQLHCSAGPPPRRYHLSPYPRR